MSRGNPGTERNRPVAEDPAAERLASSGRFTNPAPNFRKQRSVAGYHRAQVPVGSSGSDCQRRGVFL